MRYAAKIDENQPAIVKALRSVGASVQPLHTVGGGVPDLLVGWRGRNFAMEVKDGSKPPSARELTPAQVDWHQKWRGDVHIVSSVAEALAVLGIRTPA